MLKTMKTEMKKTILKKILYAVFVPLTILCILVSILFSVLVAWLGSQIGFDHPKVPQNMFELILSFITLLMTEFIPRVILYSAGPLLIYALIMTFYASPRAKSSFSFGSISGVTLGGITGISLSIFVLCDPHGYTVSERENTILVTAILSVVGVGIGLISARILFRKYKRLNTYK